MKDGSTAYSLKRKGETFAWILCSVEVVLLSLVSQFAQATPSFFYFIAIAIFFGKRDFAILSERYGNGYGYKQVLLLYLHSTILKDQQRKSVTVATIDRSVFPENLFKHYANDFVLWTGLTATIFGLIFLFFDDRFNTGDMALVLSFNLISFFSNLLYWFLHGRIENFWFSEKRLKSVLVYQLHVPQSEVSAIVATAKEEGWVM